MSFATEFKGTIIDKATREPLIGASIIIKDSNSGAVTDFDGNFTIVADDNDLLVIQYVGYQEKQLRAGALAESPIVEMTTDNPMLDEITIVSKARQDTEGAVVEKQKNSMAVQSGVSSEQIQKTQDKDASEVIKRVPGISIIDDKFVMVRGLSQRYNNVWINGATAPSSEPDSRAFSFDIIPSNQIDNLIIVKSPTPEYPADFSGGLILVNTKNMPEQNSTTFSIGGNINENTHFQDFRYSKGSPTDFLAFDNGFRRLNGGINGPIINHGQGVDLLNNHFNNDWTVKNRKPWSDLSINASTTRFWKLDNGGKMGLIGSLNYSNKYSTYLNMTNSLFGAYDVEHDQSNYLRNSTDNQYTNDSRLGAMLNVAYQTMDGNHRIELKNAFNQLGKDRYTERFGFNSQSDMERSAEYYYSSRSSYTGQLAGEHTLKDVNFLNWNLGYSYANKNMPDRRRYMLTDALQPGEIGLVNGNDINREYTYLSENSFSGKIDYKRTFELGSIKPTLKAGGFGEYRTRKYRTRNFIYSWNPGENNLPDNFRYIDITQLLSNEEYFGENGLYLLEDVKWSNNYDGNNLLTAGYVGANIPVGNLNIYAGVRYEHTTMKLISNTRDYEESPSTTTYTYNDFFPSANLVYKFNDKHQMRMAYGRSVNRPEFRELSASIFYDFDLASNVQGNPELKSCYIQNLDLRYEFYPSRNEQFDVALFYKRFNNPIEWTYTVAGGTDLIYSYKNAESATSYGIEVNVKKCLDFIGLDNFAIIFNGSLLKSVVNFAEGENEKDRPMQGQSPYLVNTGLFYEHEQYGWNACLLYNRIGKRLVGVGRSMGSTTHDMVEVPDSYEMPRNSLDFNISKKFGKGFEIKLNVKDILGESVCYKQFNDVTTKDGQQKEIEEVTRKFTPGRNYSLSISYKF